MKRSLFLIIAFLALNTTFAQELPTNVNTLKERINLSGYAQTGYTYDDRTDLSTFDIKRIIFMAEGKITDKWLCYFMYTFGGTLTEIYSQYTFSPALSARLGQFKTPYSIENLMSPTVVELINCASLATNYLAGIDNSDKLYGGTGGRDIGLMIQGDLWNNLLHYQLALMNGQGINLKDQNTNKDIVGNLMVKPLKWLSVGGSFIQGKGHALATSDMVPGIVQGDDYTRNRWAAGVLVETKPVSLRSEYLNGKDGEVKSDGFYATVSYHLIPNKIDAVASYDYFNGNKSSGNQQTNYVAGVQYWFYPKCRLQLQYTFRNVKKGENSNLIQTQIQVRF
jgi:phosphate-selective porin